MEIFDNVSKTVRNDMATSISRGSRLDIAAACFSIYAYQELKKQLAGIEELRFIFTSQTFTQEKAPKQKREFYIPRLNRERSLFGTEFEIKLRNELSQKAVARECAEWIRKKAIFKSNITHENMSGFINVRAADSQITYMPVNGFTTVDIGCERGNNTYNMVTRMEAPHSQEFIRLFDLLWADDSRLQDVTEEVLDSITTAYKENAPDFIYFFALYNIFSEFLEDINEDVLPNEATGFRNSRIWGMLYSFQKDAALAIINKLEKYNGCILADSVGLGKTFTALAVIKYYEIRNKSVLVLCPKKLTGNWNTFKYRYKNNPILEDRLRYDVLYHTDLSRDTGLSNGIDLSMLSWENYDLVVIDESHNFRNGGQTYGEDNRENRYLRLMNQVVRPGVKTRVLMLSATPVNNKFIDLKNQLALAYEGNTEWIDGQLNTSRSIDEIFRAAQTAFNEWSKRSPAERTTASLLGMLSFDFFEVLDSVTIARSRKHIQRYYSMEEIGRFPERLKPISLYPKMTDLKDAISYNSIFEELMHLSLSVYTPTFFIQPSRIEKYESQFLDNPAKRGITQAGREQGIRRLMAINLMKRLESSVYAFRLTLGRIQALMEDTMRVIDAFIAGNGHQMEFSDLTSAVDFDEDDQNTDFFSIGRKVKIDLADMDYLSWRSRLEKDRDILELLSLMVGDITPEYDLKLQELLRIICHKVSHPINGDNKKALIFTAFAETAEYLYEHVSRFAKDNFNLDTAMITGSVEGRSTIKRLRCDLNTVLTCFSPISKDKALLMPDNPAQIDLLIATDCISEGQNLQDCDYLINYDIHWNPVRIIQRFGRIDRIGSRNAVIQLVNFWPDITLDEYINLKGRVETRMKIVDMAATGDDNLLSDEEKIDLEYRKRQLRRLQEEVVDIEDVSGGISILDLGLNEFRLDLLAYVKDHPPLDGTPFGMHAVVPATADAPPGIAFVLKNINGGVNVNNRNRLHPFYMVYIARDGSIICDHLSPKELLDRMRHLCKGKPEPIRALCQAFNGETDDGRDMRVASDLLGQAIASIIQVKEKSDLDSFLSGEQVSFVSGRISGLDDFELICFLVVREEG